MDSTDGTYSRNTAAGAPWSDPKQTTGSKSPQGRRRIVWCCAALIGAILAVFLVPRILKHEGTPERLRSREASQVNLETATPVPAAGQTWETEGVSVQFNPVEADSQEETSSREPESSSSEGSLPGPADKVQ